MDAETSRQLRIEIIALYDTYVAPLLLSYPAMKKSPVLREYEELVMLAELIRDPSYRDAWISKVRQGRIEAQHPTFPSKITGLKYSATRVLRDIKSNSIDDNRREGARQAIEEIRHFGELNHD